MTSRMEQATPSSASASVTDLLRISRGSGIPVGESLRLDLLDLGPQTRPGAMLSVLRMHIPEAIRFVTRRLQQLGGVYERSTR